MIFLDTTDAYKNLSEKVRLFFKWVVDHCAGKPLVFKTDDDSFVRLDLLLKMIRELPNKRLYLGRITKQQPAHISKKTGKLEFDNFHKLKT